MQQKLLLANMNNYYFNNKVLGIYSTCYLSLPELLFNKCETFIQALSDLICLL